MDPKHQGVLLSITEFKGVNTNAPRGTVPTPELLLNVNMDRTGGWSPMRERSLRLDAVIRALSAHRADHLWVESGGQVRYWRSDRPTPDPIANAPAVLGNATPVMPDLLLTPTGFVHRLRGEVTWTDPAGRVVGMVQSVEDPAKVIPAGMNLDVLVEISPTPDAPYLGTVLLQNIGAGQTAPFNYLISWTGSGTWPIMRFYVREPGGVVLADYKYVGSNILPDGRLTASSRLVDLKTVTTPIFTLVSSLAAPASDAMTFAWTGQLPTTYHQGRVFIAPDSATYNDIEDSPALNTRTDAEPTRVYFSQVIARASDTALPMFNRVNYFDAPLRVSRRIVALASVGSYLYIFGDRELLVMTGDPERDARIENIGDSIGAVSGQSVQQLSGIVYWQSDSGVLAVQGGQVREVGEPVRDQLIALGLDVTATVDFQREQYILTDGATILVYHARENAWTTRQVEGSGTPALVYGGGTAYMVQAGKLWSIGGESGVNGRPSRLPMHIRFPPYELGDWRTRKSFSGVAFGLDLATSSAYVQNLSTVDGYTDQEATNAVAPKPGDRLAVRLHMAHDGIDPSGNAVSLEFKVETQDTRGIVRPPLTLYGNPNAGEELWVDDYGL